MGPRSQRDDAVGRDGTVSKRVASDRMFPVELGGPVFFLGGGKEARKEGRKEGHLMKPKTSCFIDVDVLNLWNLWMLTDLK